MPQDRVQNTGEAVLKTLAASVQGIGQGLDQRRESEQKIRTEKLQNFMSVLQFENAERDQQAANLRNQKVLQEIDAGSIKLKELNRRELLGVDGRAAEDAKKAADEQQLMIDTAIGNIPQYREAGVLGAFTGVSVGGLPQFAGPDPTTTPKDIFTSRRDNFIKRKSNEIGSYETQIGIGGIEEKVWIPGSPTAAQLVQWEREFDAEFGVEGRLPELVEPTKTTTKLPSDLEGLTDEEIDAQIAAASDPFGFNSPIPKKPERSLRLGQEDIGPLNVGRVVGL